MLADAAPSGTFGAVIPASRRSLHFLGLALALMLATWAREGEALAVTQAIIWLPSGVAIAGAWWLGPRALWIVAVVTSLNRVLMDYPPLVVLSAAAGSTAEAWLGAWVLRRFGLRGDFGSLRDVVAVFVCAGIAPLASIACSGLARQIPDAWRDLPFYSGWFGWWRMNALGVLTIVPPALAWLSPRPGPHRPHGWIEAGALLVGTLGVLWFVMAWLPADPTSIVLLYLALPGGLLAALRFGPRGATTVGAAAALFVALLATQGIGPFQCAPLMERHVALQIFEITMLAVPLLMGSLIAEREANSAQRMRSEGLRQALLHVLPDIAYRMSLDGTFVEAFVPSGTEAPPPNFELIGKRITEVARPELAERITAAIDLAHRNVRPEPIEYDLETTMGSRVREARFVRLGAEEVLCVVRDITERKRAQRLIAWQAEILELIATGRPNHEVFAALVTGLESFLAPGIGSLLLLEGRRLRVVCAPGLPAAFNAAIDGFEIGSGRGSCGTAAHENRTVVTADLQSDPAWAPMREMTIQHGLRACWSVPVHTAGGAVSGTFAIYHRTAHEPTPIEIRFVERAAVLAGIAIDRERREDLLAAINRNVGEGLFRCVPGQGLLYANDALARMFGYASPAELLSAVRSGDLQEPHHREDLASFAVVHAARSSEEVQLHRRDGSTFWGLLTRTAVHGADGQLQACDGALADVTEQKQLAEQLRQTQKVEAVGKLAGGVAHDFNNLLTVISGYAETLRDRVPDDELRNDVDEIRRAAERAANLTRQLLAFSRRQVLQPQNLDLPVVVDRMSTLLTRLIGEHIRFDTRFTRRPCHVRVDKGQLEQVLLNLAVNARDAMPSGGNLTISIDTADVDAAFAAEHVDLAPGPYVALSVKDDGVGMTAEVASRAFDPFFTTKEQGKGTGLGLSTVYGIVKQSGGAVWIESRPGAGTTVRIYLPAVDSAPSDDATPTLSPTSAHQATILVAEDEQMVRDLVQRILSRAGYEVLTAADGLAALELAERRPATIDLLITDVVMPNLGGRDLARRILVTHPHVPVLFLSGYAHDNDDLLAASPAATEFLQKPFANARLLEAVEGLLERAHRKAVGSQRPPGAP